MTDSKNSIPVIGTAIVNTPYWVTRLLYSVDYPVDTFVIFNNNGRDQITAELDSLKNLNHKFIKKIVVCHLPANLGCSGAWNLIIKSYMKAPYWVISNHDVAFMPGFLEALVQKQSDPEVGIVHGGGGGWDLFSIKDWVVQEYGLFDENLYPGYCEDMDYGMRFRSKPLKRVMSVDVPYLHGTKINSYDDGSQTWRSEPAIAQAIHLAHELNKQYLHAKWSPAWQDHVEGEPFAHPFNNEKLPLDFSSYDLNFVRAKHLGF